jgi:hypothetical protein
MNYPWLAAPVVKMSDRDKREFDRIDTLSTVLANRIRQAFLDAIRGIAEKIDLKQIADYLAAGRTADAIGVVNAQLIADGLVPLSTSITDATIAAGRSAVGAMREVQALSGLNISFGQTNPATVAHLRSYEMDKIIGMTQQALASVKTAITAGVQAGRNPIDVARDVRGAIGLTDRQTQAVANFRAALENQQADALDRALRDKRFDATVARAIRDKAPIPKAKIDAMVERYRARYLKYRSEVIARTEAITALNAGNRLAWKQAIADGKIAAAQVTRKWIYTHDGKARHAHRTIPALNADGVGIDEPFKSELGPILYPGDPNATAANRIQCRCAQVIRFHPSAS